MDSWLALFHHSIYPDEKPRVWCNISIGVGAEESSRGIVVQHGSKLTVQSFPLTFGLNFGCNSGLQFLLVD